MLGLKSVILWAIFLLFLSFVFFAFLWVTCTFLELHPDILVFLRALFCLALLLVHLGITYTYLTYTAYQYQYFTIFNKVWELYYYHLSPFNFQSFSILSYITDDLILLYLLHIWNELGYLHIFLQFFFLFFFNASRFLLWSLSIWWNF